MERSTDLVPDSAESRIGPLEANPNPQIHHKEILRVVMKKKHHDIDIVMSQPGQDEQVEDISFHTQDMPTH